METLHCEDCTHCVDGGLNPQDMRIHTYNCYALPPTVAAIQSQQGIAVMSMRRVIARADRACGLFTVKCPEPEKVGMTE